ncbi:hypothetical protein ACFOY8_24030 [Thalassospira xianhensis]|nr:hypothetical protein [Thalassospira xianhensis]
MQLEWASSLKHLAALGEAIEDTQKPLVVTSVIGLLAYVRAV